MNLKDAPAVASTAPAGECQNDSDRVGAILAAYVEEGVCDAETALLDLVTDALVYNRFVNGAPPDDLLLRAQRAYFSQLADNQVWA